jgi:thioredoxin 1
MRWPFLTMRGKFVTTTSTRLLKGLLVSCALSPAVQAQGPGIPVLTPPTLETALKAGKWLIVEFGGKTCIPCVRMQPVLLEVQKRLGDRGRVNNFWIQEAPDTARRFQIMVMPTQIIFDTKGTEVLRHQGYWDPEAFQQALLGKGIL